KFGYFLAFLDFVPRIVKTKTGETQNPSELKSLYFVSRDSLLATIAALSSSTFFWFWNILSDCRNLNRRDLLAFPLNSERIPKGLKKDLSTLGEHYLKRLRSTSRTMLKGGVEIETFDYGACKPIIDDIDCVLARHFGFSEEELDFIVNFDIKYRLGHAESDE